ncbi:D-alanine--D-alanine ligase [Alkalihalobacillus pseudalcaliphilus]|uniref:D-alanine--D-alanine ligase n=1 Tax=Alkalihalobacillus pseudalcaliphilus TaxID=79884 RepID=UPI00064D7FE6|nr:D-alanine--D-alanine ligase [Alkalihalobacillus pseudalcaliphilus]KMK75820.1 D-alanine--D-alanine ligase [Alkalihalobacillus pseudalcaliphilus]
MTNKKLRVGIVFGGKSAEHEVSLQSAKNIVDAIDKSKYEVVLLGIDKSGRWHLNKDSHFLINAEDPKLIALNKTNEGVSIIPGEEKNQLISLNQTEAMEQLDVIFPIIHGTLGEDGSIQGMLRMANIPFVGSNVLGSAISMDKDIAKRLLRDAGLGVAKGFAFNIATRKQINYEHVVKELGLPVFIKPANQGSSVGVSKATNKEQFEKAVAEAFQFDTKILIEEAIDGREIECSVLGNYEPIASIPGEIIATGDFYSYDAKYIDESGAILEIPAKLSTKQVERIQETSLKAYQALNCEGLARVDVFLTEDDRIIINEINTLPGFTKISMYPKLWEQSGIRYSQLIEKLIDLAIERHERDQKLQSSINDHL